MPMNIVYLAEERRIAAALAELRDLVDGGAVDADRTRAMLAGELDAPLLSAEWIECADFLARSLTPPPGGYLTRTDVLQAALKRGLQDLTGDLVRDIDDTIRRQTGARELPSLEETLDEADRREVAHLAAVDRAAVDRAAVDRAAVLVELDALRSNLAIMCPTCAAEPGVPCASGGGALMVGSPFLPSHPERIDHARRANK